MSTPSLDLAPGTRALLDDARRPIIPPAPLDPAAAAAARAGQRMQLTWRRQDLRLRHRFATSRGGINVKQTLVVELASDGVVGRGEITPSVLYDQTLESSEAVLARVAERLATDARPPFRTHELIGDWLQQCPGHACVVAGLDNALHDWIGRRLGRPAWELLGLPAPRVATTWTLGAAAPDEMAVKLEEALRLGVTAIKVKVGTEADAEVLAQIRKRWSGPLVLDANEAWTASEAQRRVRELARFAPTVIEQPLRREDWRANAELRALGVAPIFVDEDSQTPADVVRLHGFVDGVNVKLNKCGGIREALRMLALADALGLRTMVGCFISSSLAIAAALTVAPLADFADLDGALLLADDPFEGITFERGVLTLSNDPGLGCHG